MAHFTWMFGHEEAVCKMDTAFANGRSQKQARVVASKQCLGMFQRNLKENFATLYNCWSNVDSLLYAVSISTSNIHQIYEIIKMILGAQLSSRCLWIDGSSSKCWSILTYPKRHESSLDILLVVWKCLILCQIIVICGMCWFSSSIRIQRRLKRIKSSNKFTEMLS